MSKNKNIKKAAAAQARVPVPRSYTPEIRSGQPRITRGNAYLKQAINATYKLFDCINDEDFDNALKSDTHPEGVAGASTLDLIIPSINRWIKNDGDVFAADSRGLFANMVSAKLGVRNRTSIPIDMHIRGFYSKTRGEKSMKASMSVERTVTLPPYTKSGQTDYTVVDFYQKPSSRLSQAPLIWSAQVDGEPEGNMQDWMTICSFFFTYNGKTIAGDVDPQMDAVEIITPENRKNQAGKEVTYGVIYEVDNKAKVMTPDDAIPVITREVDVAASIHFTDVAEFYEYNALAGSAIASFGGLSTEAYTPFWTFPDSRSHEYRSVRILPHPNGGNCMVMYNVDINSGDFLDPVEYNGYASDDYLIIDPSLKVTWDRDQNDRNHPHSHWNVGSNVWQYDRQMNGYVFLDGYTYMKVESYVENHGHVPPKVPAMIVDQSSYKRAEVASLLEGGKAQFSKKLWKEGDSGTFKEVLASTLKSFSLGLLEYLITSIVV